MTPPSFRLDGPDSTARVALVTGAAGGIGARVALGLAEFGADVACLDTASSEKTVAAIQEIGRRAVALAGDVSDAEQMADAVARTQSALGPTPTRRRSRCHASSGSGSWTST